MHAKTHVDNNVDSKVEVTSCSKDKQYKCVLDGVPLQPCFYISQMTFMD